MLKTKDFISKMHFMRVVLSRMSFKVVPINLLKFSELGIHEKGSLLYKEKSDLMSKSHSKLKLNLGLTTSTIISSIIFPKVIPLSIVFQSYVLRNILRLKKQMSMVVEEMYLLKNGRQLLIFTIDKTINLVNIKDIIEREELSEDRIYLRTYDKKFLIDLRNEISEFYLFKKIVLESYNVETRFALKKYNRFTINKIPEFLREQIRKNVITYTLPSYSKNNINSLKGIYRKKHLTHLLYFNKNCFEKKIRNRMKDSFYLAKKRIGLDLYSNLKFERKFGLDIYHFMARLNSSEEERDKCLKIIHDCPTNGRNIVSYKKKLKLN